MSLRCTVSLFSLSSSLHCSFGSRSKNLWSQGEFLFRTVYQLQRHRAHGGSGTQRCTVVKTGKDSDQGWRHGTLPAGAGSEPRKGHRAKGSAYPHRAKDTKPPSKLTLAEGHTSFPPSAPQLSILGSRPQRNSPSHLHALLLFTRSASSPPGLNTPHAGSS